MMAMPESVCGMRVPVAKSLGSRQMQAHADIVDAFVKQVVEVPVAGLFDQRADRTILGAESVAQIDEVQPFGGRFILLRSHVPGRFQRGQRIPLGRADQSTASATLEVVAVHGEGSRRSR